MDPPVFLLPGFLSAAEADELVGVARKKEMFGSEVDQGHRADLNRMFADKRQRKEILREQDLNDDGHLNAEEVRGFLMELFTMPNFDKADFATFMAHAKPEDPAA